MLTRYYIDAYLLTSSIPSTANEMYLELAAYLSEFLVEFGGVQLGWWDEVFVFRQVKNLNGYVLLSPARSHVFILVGGVLSRLRQAYERTQVDITHAN